MSALFEIEQLDCGYHPRTVLKVTDLEVPKVPMTFILGPSGIGKSTFLEMTGLMTNTQLNQPNKFAYFSNGQPVDLSDFWSWDEQKQSNFRKSKYSFVFQQTNLMPNFSILENLCVPLLIQGQSFEEAEEHVTQTALSMDLPEKLLLRPITEASGGQLQRIAFTRALSANFEVLFGDEPTGNLDPGNARNLMNQLKSNLKTRNASAIIVSHDLKLAEEYADCIIRIEKIGNGDDFVGQMSNKTKTMS